MIHLIYIPFRGVGIDLRGDAWFKERIEIFKKYTLASLKNQSNQNFVLWLSFRPQDESNPLIKEITLAIRAAGLRWVLTFDGLMYHDDKFTDKIWPKIRNVGRIIRHSWRTKSFEFFWPSLKEIRDNKNRTLQYRLAHSLYTFRKYFIGADYVIMSRIDSDDMYHREFVDRIQKFGAFNGAVVCKKGFIYNDSTDEMAEWIPKTNPPFHTIIFGTGVFFDAEKHIDYYNGYQSHEDAAKVFPNIAVMPDYSYCVLTHNPVNHISTIWNHPFKGNKVPSNLIKNYVG